ncbi:GGDEF domain-containing protein [Notoacmeibacter ruber]|uniref:GGDEF domain-containing protein n=1 Tax=Notoacmeibacter ruber TaxID=2670375 RepID=UPI0013145EC1|nr:GGDEF domain-containing protein [Notoacmeibacter ruber]
MNSLHGAPPKITVGDQRYRLDRWLRLPQSVVPQFEKEYGAERVAHLRKTVLLGLLLYNCYNLVDHILLPDIGWIAPALRSLVLTSAGFLIFLTAGHVDAVWRERSVLFGCIVGVVIIVALFSVSTAPDSIHTIGEVGLAVIFANMVAVLRFPHAVVYTAIAFLSSCAAFFIRQDIPSGLSLALLLQVFTACAYSLYGNYLSERRRALDYLMTLSAKQRAERAETEGLKLRDLARRDALTGLPNRRALDDTFRDWFQGPDPVTIMMVDLDHFKEFNDRFGHQAGDECLRQIGQVLQAATSDEGMFAARYGGEEFAVVIRNVERNAAQRFAHALVCAVESMAIEHPCGPGGVVTVSVGLAFRDKNDSVAEVLAAADRALYWAKYRGRNRFEITSEPVVFEEAVVQGRAIRDALTG